MRTNRGLVALATSVAASLVGCSDHHELGDGAAALAIAGRWLIPTSTLSIGDQQHVEFTDGGPWLGPEQSCTGGMEPGTVVLRDYLAAHYPQVRSIGGYACRPIVGDSSATSVHATGRALDIMLPLTSDGEADNDLGDPIGRFLIEHAAEIGIQQIIWDRTVWRASRTPGAKESTYGGEHPHHDHLHVELSVEAGVDMATPWFAEGVRLPPAQPGCPAVGAAGAVLDDGGDCLTMFGPTRSWRVVDGAGEGGSYLWTNAFEGAAPSNWARWHLDFEEGGEFEVEVHLPAGAGVHRAARYEVVHGGQVTAVELDQAAGDGWRPLGRFGFAAGGGQHVDLFDHAEGPVAADQRIAVDAIRLRPAGGGDGGGGDRDGRIVATGCQAGGPASDGGLILALAALVTRRRRRRRP
jgi:MYXO-CTERM domain-containing protein